MKVNNSTDPLQIVSISGFSPPPECSPNLAIPTSYCQYNVNFQACVTAIGFLAKTEAERYFHQKPVYSHG